MLSRRELESLLGGQATPALASRYISVEGHLKKRERALSENKILSILRQVIAPHFNYKINI